MKVRFIIEVLSMCDDGQTSIYRSEYENHCARCEIRDHLYLLENACMYIRVRKCDTPTTWMRVCVVVRRENRKPREIRLFGLERSSNYLVYSIYITYTNAHPPDAETAAQCRHPHDDGLTATKVITDAFQGAPTEYRNYADAVIIFATRLLGSILN